MATGCVLEQWTCAALNAPWTLEDIARLRITRVTRVSGLGTSEGSEGHKYIGTEWPPWPDSALGSMWPSREMNLA